MTLFMKAKREKVRENLLQLTEKELAKVERPFRYLEGMDLQVQPIFHRTEERVKAHPLLCMLAYYIEWHLRRAWAGLLFHDEDGGRRTTPVTHVEPSESAKAKKRSPRLNPDLPLQTYRGLIQSLAALFRTTIQLGSSSYIRCVRPTPLLDEAFKRPGLALLLSVSESLNPCNRHVEQGNSRHRPMELGSEFSLAKHEGI